MTPEKIELVQSSFYKLLPVSNTAAALFYSRLFELDSRLALLFTNDLEGQGRKLIAMLKVAVDSLENLDTFLPNLQQLGQRHVGYGVEPKDYDTVAQALLWMLEQVLREDFTAATKQAWAMVYQLLADNMQSSSVQVA